MLTLTYLLRLGTVGNTEIVLNHFQYFDMRQFLKYLRTSVILCLLCLTLGWSFPAQAAWAAKQQGKFWEYQDALFTNQKELGETLYLDIAKKLDLNLQKFESDRKLGKTEIEKDIQLAEKLGITGTPFLVINTPNYTGAVQASEIEGRLGNAS